MPTLFATAAGWTDALLVGLLAFAIRATALLCAAWLATRLLRHASAATRHLVWSVTIAGILALPVLQTFLPAWNVPVFSVAAALDAPLGAVAMPATPANETIVAPPAPSLPMLRAAEPAATISRPAVPLASRAKELYTSVSRLITVSSAIAILWLTFAALLLARLAIANVRVSSWQRSSRAVEDPHWLGLLRRLAREYGIERPVVLLEHDATDVPVTWGIVYPVVLIPSPIAAEWDEEQRKAVLTHELAHVKRFDAFTQLLAQLALALLWFHPLVWMAVRRMRLEREHACDDFVLAAGARASRYADDLLGFARKLARPTAPAAAALAMARRSELEGRLLAILDPATKRTAVRRARVAALTLAVLALAAPLAAFRPGVRVQASSPLKLSATVAAVSPPAAVAILERRSDAPLTARRREDAKVLASALPALTRAPSDTEPVYVVDLETLIDVTKAAKRMTSDHEKGQLLALIAKRYQRSDALRDAYLEAVLTMTSDQERGQALLALLDRDSLPLGAIAQVLRSTATMTSDMNKGLVLKRISPSVFADSSVQRAYIDAIVGMTSDLERGAAISSLVKQRPLAPAVQLALLQATVVMTSDLEKANVLLLFLDRQGIADEKTRRTFFKVAESITSDNDYRRVMTAVMR